MSSVQTTITQLPQAGPITGTESVPIVQNGQTVQTTTGAIAASPSQQQPFLTVNQQPSLPNSRALSSSIGIGLVDGGPLSTLQITLNGVSGSLETSNDGIIVKSSGTVVGRSITSSGNGISVANANGTAGNPVLSLTGPVGDINGLAGTGILGIVSGTSITSMTLLGTTNQIDIANGQGPGNPTFSLASNTIVPGTGSITIPKGTIAQRPPGAAGEIRYNTDTGQYEVYQGGWVDLSTSAGAVDFYHNGVLVASGDGLNFINSANISLTVMDDPINGWVDVTPNLTTTGVAAGSYGSQSNTLTASVDVYGRLSALAQTAIGNLPNAALQNSSVTYNGVTVALGASGTITAASPNSVTFNNSGSGDVSGTSYDGSAARTISYNTLGAPSTTGTNASGTWNISILGNAATATTAGAVANAVTFTNTGGASPGTTFDGSVARTVDYSTLGAPSTTGTNASGTWNISILGNAATATSSTTSTNLAGGAGGSVPYQSGAGSTTFLSIGSNGQVLTSSGTAPQYVDQSTLSVGSATTSTNLAGGAAGSIPYQTGAGSTTFLAQSSGVLVGGAVPSYSTAPSLTGTNFSSIPNGALQNSSITIGTTGISLGTTASTLAGLTSVTVTQPPSSALQLATKQYVDDAVSTGITIHSPVRVETPTALNATYLAGGTSVTVTDITGSKTLTFSSSPSLSINDQIVFSSTSNGIVAGTAYYVYSAPAANQVTLSLTYNGPEITTLTNGTGLTIGGLVNAGVGATLTNAGTNAAIQIDGVTLSATNRVLVYNQTNAYENGVYTVTTVGTPDPGGTAWVLTRATTEDTYKPDSISGLGQGDYFFVQEGLTGAGESYVMTTSNPMIIGTTNLTFTQFSASQVYSAGTGLTLVGTTFSLTSPVVTGLGGTGLTSYTAGDIVYYAAGTAFTKLGIGTSTTIMTSTGSAPQWSAASGITVGAATNIAGGAAGSVPYNTGSGTTTFLGIGSSTFLLTSTGTAPQWSDPSGVTVGTATNAVNSGITLTSTNTTFYPSFVANTSGNEPIRVASGLTFNPSTNVLTTTTFSGALSGNATTATTATNVAGGATGSIVYQSATSTTAMLSLGSLGYFLTAGASAPQYSDPTTLTVGTATNANNVAVTASSVNATFYPAFVDATSGNQSVEVDADLTYNPSTNTLTAGTMVATTGIFGGTF